MPRKDSFDPADPMSRYLAGQAEPEGLELEGLELEGPELEGLEPDGLGNIRDHGVTASRVFLSILLAAVMATGAAALALGNPVALLTEVTASLAGNPSPHQSAAPSPPAIQTADNAPALVQSNADAKTGAEALTPAASDTPPASEIAAAEPTATEPAAKDAASNEPTEAIAPSSDALFRRFQAWLSDQDAQAKAEPVQPAQDAPVQAEPNAPVQAEENVRAPAPHRLAQKHRQARAVHNASAETRAQNVRRQTPRAQDARTPRAPARPVQDARAQELTPAPGASAPSFLPPIFGQRN